MKYKIKIRVIACRSAATSRQPKSHTFIETAKELNAVGSLSDGTMDYTPQPSVDAFVMSAKSGTLIIGCTP